MIASEAEIAAEAEGRLEFLRTLIHEAMNAALAKEPELFNPHDFTALDDALTAAAVAMFSWLLIKRKGSRDFDGRPLIETFAEAMGKAVASAASVDAYFEIAEQGEGE